MFRHIKSIFDFIQNYFKTVVFLTILAFVLLSSDGTKVEKPNLAQIDLMGPIMDSAAFLKELDELVEDKNIKGILVNINSPGGAVAPSVEIAHAIKQATQKKPVVSYASGMMTSGSYYSAIWSNKIISNPGSLIGSIGVIFQSANMQELASKIGIKRQSLKVGKYKDTGTPFRAWLNYEKQELATLLKETYTLFISDVAQARGLSIKDHTQYADAHIFSAKMALQQKLIDQIGTIYSAKDELAKLSSVQKPVWKEKDKMELFIEKITHNAFTYIHNSFNGLWF
jgi:protease-4